MLEKKMLLEKGEYGKTSMFTHCSVLLNLPNIAQVPILSAPAPLPESLLLISSLFTLNCATDMIANENNN